MDALIEQHWGVWSLGLLSRDDDPRHRTFSLHRKFDVSSPAPAAHCVGWRSCLAIYLGRRGTTGSEPVGLTEYVKPKLAMVYPTQVGANADWGVMCRTRCRRRRVRRTSPRQVPVGQAAGRGPRAARPIRKRAPSRPPARGRCRPGSPRRDGARHTGRWLRRTMPDKRATLTERAGRSCALAGSLAEWQPSSNPGHVEDPLRLPLRRSQAVAALVGLTQLLAVQDCLQPSGVHELDAC